MKCLCCGKKLNQKEEQTGWHKQCIRRFFGTDVLPSIQLSDEELERLADSAVSKGLTVPGVQKKLSLHLSSGKEKRLTIVDEPAGYILKPQSEEFTCLPECEQMVMTMADQAGLRTAPHALIRINDHELAYITKRVDRSINTDTDYAMYAMEDFCQLSNRLTSDKYSSSYERCAAVIGKYSDQPGIDLAEFFMCIVFCFITGNSDMHLKNFSMIEKKPASRIYVLSPAYDMLAVNLAMPEDKEETALTLNEKKNNLHRNDFLLLADRCNINSRAAVHMIDELTGRKDQFLETVNDSFMPDSMKEDMKHLITERISRLPRNPYEKVIPISEMAFLSVTIQ